MGQGRSNGRREPDHARQEKRSGCAAVRTACRYRWRARRRLSRPSTIRGPSARVMTPRRGGNPGSPPPDISGASDTTTVSYHGLVHTHMDAFCHRAYKGLMFNGMPMTEVTETACNKGSIFAWKDGIVTRGVLIDIPRLKGRRVPRAGHTDLSGRSGCLGQAGASQD